MRALILWLVATPCALAQPVSVAPWMTGQQLVDLAAWPAGVDSTLDLTPQQNMRQELAKMFVAGVHDATEGKSWCFSQIARPKSHVLTDIAIDGLRGMRPEKLKRAAANLIVETWRAKYPCPTERKNP